MLRRAPAPRRMKVSRENYVRGARMRKIWGEEALDFQEKLLNSSGLGDETYFPDSARPRLYRAARARGVLLALQ